jgi:ATP-dependent Clp protease adaptor protein ClpS
MSQSPFDRPPRQRGPDGQAPAHVPSRRELPRYKVVLHGFAEKGLMFVVRTVMELTRLGRAEATHKMWEAHHRGRSVLLVTHQERAELYVEQFADKELRVSIEPT